MEDSKLLLAKVFRIQKMLEPLSKSQRLQFYNTVVEMNETEVAEIMLSLIELLDNLR
jgi:hypothetical protein